MSTLMVDVNKLGCPTCLEKSVPLMDHSSGDLICTTCGLVLDGQCLDEAAEWRNFATDGVGEFGDGNARARGDMCDGNRDVLGLDGIGHQGTGISGSGSGPGGFSELQRAQQLTDRTQVRLSTTDRLLKSYSAKVTEMAKHLGLNENIVGQCIGLLKSLARIGELKGTKGQETFFGAIIAVACREEKLTRTNREIAYACAPRAKRNMLDFEKDLEKRVKRLQSLLASELRELHQPRVPASEVMPRFVSRLQLPREVCATAEHIVEQTFKAMIAKTARQQDSLFAAAIFIAAWVTSTGASPQLAEVAREVHVSEMEALQMYEKMRKHVERLLPPDLEMRRAVPALHLDTE